MDEAERQMRVAQFRAEALQAIDEDNEHLAAKSARDRCDECPRPKVLRSEVITLPNGIRFSVYAEHCQEAGPDCTALVCSYLLSEPSSVANRVVEWLTERPELKTAGVSYKACLAPEADRLILTYQVPSSSQVKATLSAATVEDFRSEPVDLTCAGCGQPIARDRLNFVPGAVRCVDCQAEMDSHL